MSTNLIFLYHSYTYTVFHSFRSLLFPVLPHPSRTQCLWSPVSLCPCLFRPGPGLCGHTGTPTPRVSYLSKVSDVRGGIGGRVRPSTPPIRLRQKDRGVLHLPLVLFTLPVLPVSGITTRPACSDLLYFNLFYFEFGR